MKQVQRILLAAMYVKAAIVLVFPSVAYPEGIEKNSASLNLTTPREGRRWTSQDSVALRYFETEAVSIAPDGSKFFFTTYRGDLSCDCNVFELAIFSAADVKNSLVGTTPHESPRPLRTITRRSSDHNGAEFGEASWETDSESIRFRGVSEKGLRQIYRLNVVSGELKALTDLPYGLQHADIVGETVIADGLVPREEPGATKYPAQWISQTRVAETLFVDTRLKRNATFVSYRSGPAWEIKGTEYMFPFSPSFTSDGRRAVSVRAAREIPSRWKMYDGLSTWVAGKVDKTPTTRFVLIDAERGSTKEVFDAPAGMATQVGLELSRTVRADALWARDGVHVVLVNSALPLSAEANDEHLKMAYIVGYNTNNGQWMALEPLQSSGAAARLTRRVSSVGWLKEGVELLVRHEASGRPAPGTLYSLKGDRWIGRAVSADIKLPEAKSNKPTPLRFGLAVRLQQGANEPPVMIASDGRSEVALSKPDAALEGLWWARRASFTWTSPNGESITGGLLLPRAPFTQPFPLVIQAYRDFPDKFLPDGPSTHAYAAQSLVARGFAVLNVTIPGEDMRKLGKLRELTDFTVVVESSIEALAKEGIVDPDKVGLIGFSRGGYETHYAITHPGHYAPVAAIIDDGFPGTLGYLMTIRAINESLFTMYGGTFWNDRASWLEHDPSFNVHRVKAATLFTVHNEQAIPYALETIGAFAMNGVPMEYWAFAKGSHTLEMPRERFVSQELSLDWLSFWVQGQEDPAPDKADQYVRWRALRVLKEQRKAE